MLGFAALLCLGRLELEQVFGAHGPAPMALMTPVACVQSNPKVHELAVVEYGSHRVTIVSSSGHFKRVLSAPRHATYGSSSAASSQPRGITAIDGSVIVAERKRLIRLSSLDGRPTMAAARTGSRRLCTRKLRGR